MSQWTEMKGLLLISDISSLSLPTYGSVRKPLQIKYNMSIGWILLSNSINGQRPLRGFGFTIDLSVDGIMIAKGTKFSLLRMRSFCLSLKSSEEPSDEVRSEIYFKHHFLYTVKISSNGNALAVEYQHYNHGHENFNMYDVNITSFLVKGYFMMDYTIQPCTVLRSTVGYITVQLIMVYMVL